MSHLGKLRVVGDEGGRALQAAVTADVMALEPGAAKYALVLTDEGGTIDDIFVYRIGDEEWLVVPNAANDQAVANAIAASGYEPVDEWDRWAILAIQGPDSFELFDKVFPGTGATDLKLHRWTHLDVFGVAGHRRAYRLHGRARFRALRAGRDRTRRVQGSDGGGRAAGRDSELATP